jgi:hypothetical protein
MGYANGLNLKGSRLYAVARLKDPEIDLFARKFLLQLAADERCGEFRTINWDLHLTKQIGQTAHVVFVRMGHEDPPDVLAVLYEIGEIGNDDVDTQHFLIRKAETAVNHNDVVILPDYAAVLADLAYSAQGDDLNQRHEATGYLSRSK